MTSHIVRFSFKSSKQFCKRQVSDTLVRTNNIFFRFPNSYLAQLETLPHQFRPYLVTNKSSIFEQISACNFTSLGSGIQLVINESNKECLPELQVILVVILVLSFVIGIMQYIDTFMQNIKQILFKSAMESQILVAYYISV